MGYKNRGMLLESIINKSIHFFHLNDMAILHKKSVPIKIQKVKKQNGSLVLTKSLITGKSTTDYYGCYQGVFLAFEAKSTELKSLPLNNIHLHQQKYLNRVNDHGGLGFYLFYFKVNDSFHFLHAKKIMLVKTKSISLSFIRQHGIEIELSYPGTLDFLSICKKFI